MNGGPTAQELLGATSQSSIDEQLERLRRCVRCGMMYRESQNMGAWSCRAYHAMEAYRTPHQPTYQCCGRAIGMRGCVPADHTEAYEYDAEAELVGEAIAETLTTRNARWHYDEKSRRWYVRRLDAVALERCFDQAHKFNSEPLNRPVTS